MNRKKSSLGAAALSLVLVYGLLATIVRAAEPEDDFGDGVVEDVQEESAASDNAAEELVYESPNFDRAKFHFVDHFDDIEDSRKRWVKSEAKKDDTAEEIAKYDGIWQWEAPQRIVSKKDSGLVLKSKAKHAAIASRLIKPFAFEEEKPLIVQYEVTMQEGQDCGGSYIKLLSAGKHTEDLTTFNDKTPYTIMFGPDKCGNDIKMHFIFRHVNPINGSISEKHCRKPKDRLEEPFKDKLPHLYQLVVRPDNTFEILVDHKIINEGSLLGEFLPPVNPPREIDDPTDIKPADWDEREKIPDPTAQKPDDWDDDAPPQIPDSNAVRPDGWLEDEPEMISDPTATIPDDWDAEIDGEWEAPLVDNPVCEKAVGCGAWKAPLIPNQAYKGKWRAPLIENPNYQGKWAARRIPNPDYFEDLNPFRMTPIAAVGIELWSMSSEILFDNLIITDDIEIAREFAANSFDIKRKFIDRESETFMNKIIAFCTQNPWVWRIAIVLLGTPIVFNLYRMFSKGGAKKDNANAKKTDEVQPDDEEGDASDGNGDIEQDKETTPLQSSPKKKKSDLNVKDVDDEQQDEEQKTQVEADETVTNKSSDETEEPTTKTTRKRQVRKD